MLVVQSLTDSCNDPADSSKLYNMLVSPKWFLALDDATHLGPYVGDGPAADVVERTTAGFFDLVVGRGNVTRGGPRSQRPLARREHDLERTRRAAVPRPALFAGRLRRPGGSADRLTDSKSAPTVYLDHAATTPMRPEAVAAMFPFLADSFGNPSGSHRVARVARQALDDAREVFAGLVGARPSDIVFTSGGTEADNLAIAGVAVAPGTALCSAVEHPAVLEACLAGGGSVIGVDRQGVVDLDQLADLLDERVRLVSVMLVNNETGVRQPLESVVALVHARAPRRWCTAMPYRRSPGSMWPR